MSTQERALVLLGQGIAPVMVASAIGVTESAISQLISDPIFSAKVAELRFANLVRHNDRDATYDSMEESLQARLKDLIPYMMKPFEILKAIQIINGAKRRGSSAPDSLVAQSAVVSLQLPSKIFNSHTTQNIQLNVYNQVVKAGETELVTIQSGNMDKLSAGLKEKMNERSQPKQLSSA